MLELHKEDSVYWNVSTTFQIGRMSFKLRDVTGNWKITLQEDGEQKIIIECVVDKYNDFTKTEGDVVEYVNEDYLDIKILNKRNQ